MCDNIFQGLNNNFAAVKSQILIMEPSPLSSNFYSNIVQQERQVNPAASLLHSPSALVV